LGLLAVLGCITTPPPFQVHSTRAQGSHGISASNSACSFTRPDDLTLFWYLHCDISRNPSSRCLCVYHHSTHSQHPSSTGSSPSISTPFSPPTHCHFIPVPTVPLIHSPLQLVDASIFLPGAHITSQHLPFTHSSSTEKCTNIFLFKSKAKAKSVRVPIYRRIYWHCLRHININKRGFIRFV
jgi:hypothetical protein